jgi:hypothetical protein
MDSSGGSGSILAVALRGKLRYKGGHNAAAMTIIGDESGGVA